MIFQDHMRIMTSEAVAEVQKNFIKFTFLRNRVYNFFESFQTFLAFWILPNEISIFLSFFQAKN